MKKLPQITNIQGRSLIAAIGVAMAAPVLAETAEQFIPEQFFLDDDSGTQTVTTSDGETRYEIRSGYAIIQGDIVVGKVLSDGSDTVFTRGVGRNFKLDRWIDGIVYYEKSPSLDGEDLQKVDDALRHWNQFSSLTFVERSGALQDTQQDYILFEASSGCASWVGKIGGEQSLWVGQTCTAGSVIHELGHAIGLFHEHTRTDRDNFITVLWENILDGKDFNFDIMDAGADDLGSYDYDSVMHYGSTFFSRNGQPTILAPDGTAVGQREALSQVDLESINSLYGTDLMLLSSVADFGSSTRVEFTVDNIGDNGAHALEIRVPQNEANSMLAFSGNGWNCTDADTEILCSIANLPDGTSSSLSVDMISSTINPNNPGAWLASKTFDTDMSNNGNVANDYQQAGTRSIFGAPQLGAALTNDTIDVNASNTVTEITQPAPVQPTPAQPTPAQPAPVQPVPVAVDTPATDNTNAAPDTSVAEQLAAVDLPEAGAATAAEASSGGGGGGGALWSMLALLMVSWRSRKISNR